jgi:hypothetical protein
LSLECLAMSYLYLPDIFFSAMFEQKVFTLWVKK